MELFIEERSSLMFIDVNVLKDLHLEMKIDPQKILDIEDNKLEETKFEGLFFNGAIQFGWFQLDESGSVASESLPAYYQTYLKLIVQKWYNQRSEVRDLGFIQQNSTSLELLMQFILDAITNLTSTCFVCMKSLPKRYIKMRSCGDD